MQPKPETTKLFPIEGLEAYHKQISNATKSLDKFWQKLRTTYNFVFRQPDNTSNVEKVTAKNVLDPNLQALKLIWADMAKADNYTNLKYPNNSFLDQVKSLWTLKNDSSVEIKTTIKMNEKNVSSSKRNSNKTETLPDDDWFNDIQPLGQLELQDEELDKKNVEIITPETTLPTTVGRHLLEWLGTLFSLTYSIYTKLSNAVCDNEKVTHW